MALKGVSQGKAHPPRIVLYAAPKFGKSTWASEAPSPIFIPTEDGVNNIKVDQFPKATSWEELLANVGQVANGEHGYKTLVIDTMNGAVELAAQAVCTQKFSGDWGPKGYGAFGQGHAATSEEIRKLITLLDVVRAREMTVILLAHTGVQTVRNPLEGDYSRYAPEMDRRIWSRFAAWSDIILRGDYDYLVKKSDNPLRAGRAIGDSTRILRCSGSAAEDAGTRVGFELPDTLPLSWADFAAALGKDTSISDEVQSLWHLLPKDKAEATYTYLGTRDITKAPITKLREVLNRLRTLAPKEEQKETPNG